MSFPLPLAAQIERRTDAESRAAISACLADYSVILEQAEMRKRARINRDNRNLAAWESRFHAARNAR